MIKIDFEDTIDIIEMAEDLSFITFNSALKNGCQILLKAKMLPLEDSLLPNVYNLSFGPLNENKEIDDNAKIQHSETAKIFSTILFFSLAYLEMHPSIIIGIDGATDARAYLYHRMFMTNKNYLKEYFIPIGVDWYVRLLRNGSIEYDLSGSPFFKPKPEPFDYERNSIDLYRYYMFHKKN